MIKSNIKIDHKGVDEAFRIAPREMTKALRKKMSRAGAEVAREARSLAAKAFSTLTSSIRSRLGDPPVSAVITAGTDYSRFVEEGTGKGGRPSMRSILDWIRVKGITPYDPKTKDRQLAFLISRAISRKGTKAQPYMEPALARKEKRVETLINQGVEEGIRAAFG